MIGAKLALAPLLESIVRLQVAVPLQAPPQPWKLQPLTGAAISVTWVPALKLALQVAPQSIPTGELVTLPPEPPATDTPSV